MTDLVAGMPVVPEHVDAPRSEHGCKSANTPLCALLYWEPQIPLQEALPRTCGRIEQQVIKALSRQ